MYGYVIGTSCLLHFRRQHVHRSEQKPMDLVSHELLIKSSRGPLRALFTVTVQSVYFVSHARDRRCELQNHGSLQNRTGGHRLDIAGWHSGISAVSLPPSRASLPPFFHLPNHPAEL